MELGPKVFPGQQKFWNSYLQNFIHFLFAKLQLVLTGRFGDIVVYEFNEYLYHGWSQTFLVKSLKMELGPKVHDNSSWRIFSN